MWHFQDFNSTNAVKVCGGFFRRTPFTSASATEILHLLHFTVTLISSLDLDIICTKSGKFFELFVKAMQ